MLQGGLCFGIRRHADFPALPAKIQRQLQRWTQKRARLVRLPIIGRRKRATTILYHRSSLGRLAQISLDHFGILLNLLGAALRDLDAVVDADHALANPHNDFHIVLHQEHIDP